MEDLSLIYYTSNLISDHSITERIVQVCANVLLQQS